MTGKTIGETNGIWAILLKVMLVVFIPWSSFITANQILDNQFRSEGARFTAKDAEAQTHQLMTIAETRLTKIEAQIEHNLATKDDFRDLKEHVTRIESILKRQ